MSKTAAEGQRNRAARAYLSALDRLIAGKATHPDYAGRPVRITPAAVAKEARRSRNPLYTTHRALLAEIEAAASGPTPAADLVATVARLEASNAELRAVIRRLQIDKRNLATENLSLLYRARLAEDRLCNRDREITANRLVSGAGACVDPRSIESRNRTARIDPRSQRV
jgi:hypothetical protein